MKLIVDKLPVTANECLFSTMGTGKPRCRHDAKLCPLPRGEECPHLMSVETLVNGGYLNPVRISAEPIAIPIEPAPEPKKRTSKRSTAKKAE